MRRRQICCCFLRAGSRTAHLFKNFSVRFNTCSTNSSKNYKVIKTQTRKYKIYLGMVLCRMYLRFKAECEKRKSRRPRDAGALRRETLHVYWHKCSKSQKSGYMGSPSTSKSKELLLELTRKRNKHSVEPKQLKEEKADAPVCRPPPGPTAAGGAWKASSLSPSPASCPVVASTLQCFSSVFHSSGSRCLTHSPCLRARCASFVYTPDPELFFPARLFSLLRV